MHIEWSDEFLVGVEIIDNQHKELFARVNSLMDAMWEGKGKREVEGFLIFLGDYVLKHFGEEESYMTMYNYPGYLAHKEIHDKFVSDFSGLKERFLAGHMTSSLAVGVLNDVCDWLRNHVKKVDKQLGAFLKEKMT